MNFFYASWTRVIIRSDAQKRELARGPLLARKRTDQLERTKEIHFLPRTPLKLAPYYSLSECYSDNGNRETNNEHNMSVGLISLVPLFGCLSEVWRLSSPRLSSGSTRFLTCSRRLDSWGEARKTARFFYFSRAVFSAEPQLTERLEDATLVWANINNTNTPGIRTGKSLC